MNKNVHFNLKDFGSKVAEYSVFFDPDKSIRSMDYQYEENEVWNFTRVKEGVLEVVNSFTDKAQRVLSWRKNFNLDDIIALKKDPIIGHPYFYDEGLCIYEYYTDYGRKYTFVLKEDEKVMFSYNKALVFQTDKEVIDFDNDPSRCIYFSKDYIMTLEQDIYRMEGLSDNYIFCNFKNLVQKDDGVGYYFPTLRLLPTEVENTRNQVTFKIEYDEDGIVKKVLNPNNLLQELSRYEATETKVLSIHPLLFDGFDFRLIRKHFIYFAFDILDKSNDPYHIFTRKIYRINNPEFLLNYLYIINTTRFMCDNLMIED